MGGCVTVDVVDTEGARSLLIACRCAEQVLCLQAHLRVFFSYGGEVHGVSELI